MKQLVGGVIWIASVMLLGAPLFGMVSRLTRDGVDREADVPPPVREPHGENVKSRGGTISEVARAPGTSEDFYRIGGDWTAAGSGEGRGQGSSCVSEHVQIITTADGEYLFLVRDEFRSHQDAVQAYSLADRRIIVESPMKRAGGAQSIESLCRYVEFVDNQVRRPGATAGFEPTQHGVVWVEAGTLVGLYGPSFGLVFDCYEDNPLRLW